MRPSSAISGGGSTFVPTYTEFAQIDPSRLEERRIHYASDLGELHAALPQQYWPVVQASPPEAYEGRPLYPGRVLLGFNGTSHLFAHLRKLTHKDTGLEMYYDGNGYETDDTVAFEDASFEPWCYLITDGNCKIESSERWDDRVKRIVKLVMLEAGYFDGPLSIHWPPIVKAITLNIQQRIIDRTSYLMAATNQTSNRDTVNGTVPALASRSSSEKITQVPATARTGSINRMREMEGPKLVAIYIKALKEAIPPELWFKTERLTAEEEASLEKMWNRPNPLAVFPGKVLVARRRQHGPADTRGIQVFAAIRKLKNEDSANRTWQMFFFSENFIRTDIANSLSEGSLSEGIQFEPVFELLSKGSIETAGAADFPTNVATCVRAVLIEDGYVDATSFKLRVAAAPDHLKALIQKKLAIKQVASQTHKSLPSTPPLLRKPNGYTIPIAPDSSGATVYPQVGSQHSSLDVRRPTKLVDLAVLDYLGGQEPMLPPTFSSGVSRKRALDRSKDAFGLGDQPSEGKKQRPVRHDPLSLLNYLGDPSMSDSSLVNHATLEEEKRTLVESVSTLEAQVAELQEKLHSQAGFRDRMTERVHTQSKELTSMRQQVKALEDFKSAHVKHCQPVMLELLTRSYLRKGVDKDLATMDAKLEYTETYGLEVIEQEDGE